MTSKARQHLSQQLREAADIVEHDFPWIGVRELGGGSVQTVGSSDRRTAFKIGVLRAIELGYTIEAQREIPAP